MEHIMKLYKDSFERLKMGEKKREYRLYDQKRQQVRIGDTIKFRKLPDLTEEYLVDVLSIEIFDDWYSAYSKYYEEDFKTRYNNVQEVVDDTFANGSYTKEESARNKVVVFTIKKHRIVHYDATVCYLKKDDKVLMIKFNNKWGQVYAPPGGKFEPGESPTECIIREFKEETGLTLINLKLQGISYWKDATEGIIYVFVASDYKGTMLSQSEEGTLEWIATKDLNQLKQFEQNILFTPYLFKNELFEGKFILNDKCQVLKSNIKTI